MADGEKRKIVVPPNASGLIGRGMRGLYLKGCRSMQGSVQHFCLLAQRLGGGPSNKQIRWDMHTRRASRRFLVDVWAYRRMGVWAPSAVAARLLSRLQQRRK